MNYTLNLELLVDYETGALFSKATLENFEELDLKLVTIFNPDKNLTIIHYLVVKSPNPYSKIIRYESIPWDGLINGSIKDTKHKVVALLYDETNVCCASDSEDSNNSGDAKDEKTEG